MKKDYYIILGVSRGATKKRIKQAFRVMAKRYHPDSGSDAVNDNKFKEVQQAYETLRDDGLRAEYDAKLANRVYSYPSNHPTTSLKKSYNRDENPFSHSFFDRLIKGNFPTVRKRKINRELAFEMILEPSEAKYGGLFSLQLPLEAPCTYCGQTGWQYQYLCSNCMGRGYVDIERIMTIRIPPNTKDGTEVTTSLDHIGLNGAALYLFISIKK